MKSIVFFIIVVSALGYLAYREVPAMQSWADNFQGTPQQITEQTPAQMLAQVQDNAKIYIDAWLTEFSSKQQQMDAENIARLENRVQELEHTLAQLQNGSGGTHDVAQPTDSTMEPALAPQPAADELAAYLHSIAADGSQQPASQSQQDKVQSLRDISNRMTLRSVEYQVN